mmetsp:Transcript_12066/g.15783  ORF Transcript_12066/g.15783 Transcript_12066/m.15783 type:complete len:122 (-) Transcript_12066:327-692(-)|eukprot:CAMPEP_0117779752 /NCGR_PEP_ID=MMETSP0948-20121206/1805_1 /TAXON_ID=44440 /ORGANISM="Chattonella subsalsa, Strain CCMP2191" /LENGTH=121 /DNA_ID=CAMNT_0005607387 /DNA_START=383 /DNA_END=748 /DNA_ORIENTATION=-
MYCLVPWTPTPNVSLRNPELNDMLWDNKPEEEGTAFANLDFNLYRDFPERRGITSSPRTKELNQRPQRKFLEIQGGHPNVVHESLDAAMPLKALQPFESSGKLREPSNIAEANAATAPPKE